MKRSNRDYPTGVRANEFVSQTEWRSKWVQTVRVVGIAHVKRGRRIPLMSSVEIDSYLQGVTEAQRATLQDLRLVILRCVPQAEECISYQVPAFRVNGSVVAGFAAFRNHMSYLPFSGSVLPSLKRSLRGYDHTKSALHFTSTDTLSDELVALLVQTRLDEILAHHR